MKYIIIILAIFLGTLFVFEKSFAEEQTCGKNEEINLDYSIHGGQIKKICLDRVALSIMVLLDNAEQGNLSIKIPRIVLNYYAPDCTDRNFIVLVNGEEMQTKEANDDKFRLVTIPIHEKDEEIEIIASITMTRNEGLNLEKCQKLIQNKFRPFEQIRYGIPPDDIKCKDSLELVFKSDHSPACVKPESIPKLIERGWANDSNTPLKVKISDLLNNPAIYSNMFLELEGSLEKKKHEVYTQEEPHCDAIPFAYVVLKNTSEIIVGLDPDPTDKKNPTFNWTVPDDLLNAKKVSIPGKYALYSIKTPDCHSSFHYFLMNDRDAIKIVEK